MRDYRIIVTPDAVRDLTELRNDIAHVLFAPETALACIQTLRREIGGLARMPARNRLMDEEPWHSRDVRKIIVENFYVYYRSDDATETVPRTRVPTRRNVRHEGKNPRLVTLFPVGL